MGNEFEEQTLSILDVIKADVEAGNAKLEDIDNKVNELDRTIRGSNGNKGLVTEVAVLQSQLVDHVDEDSHSDAKAKKEDKDDTRYITWKWFIDKGLMPIVTAATLWFLLQVLPNILSYLAIADLP